MTPNFSFEITHQDKKTNARVGIIKTRSGNIETPYLVPIATRAEIISLSKEDISAISPQAILANTYHLHFLSPGDKEIKKLGGLHKFMNFSKPIFTDSGGFQALSLGFGRTTRLRKIGFFPGKNEIKTDNKEKTFVTLKDDGILFKSVYDETEKFMGPKESMQIQSNLGSEIIMAFDQCNPPGQTEEETKKSMEISHKWELESLKHKNPEQALYGIIHGGAYPNLRVESCKFISSLSFEGIAIGGSLGKTKKEMYFLLDGIISNLKEADKKPRHMLGIGWVDDLFECVERGMDTFDCVHTTRLARHGGLYISPKEEGNQKNKYHIKIRKIKHASENKPIDSWCDCSTCKSYSRKDLHNLCRIKNPQYAKLATIHNISFMEKLMKEIRDSIKENRFQELKSYWLQK
ncbi:MAG: tRNA guanosine(34) transglycosylase Tgt [archaeon]|nr:tRNA guanosine(34) transglycosylase Tgt [archaeon]